MFTSNFKNSSIKKEDRILADLLSNAFRSVQHQMLQSPLNDLSSPPINRSRCRLNLYAMNSGILEYFIKSKYGNSTRSFVYNFRHQLVELICHADPAVYENIEKLILDNQLISNLCSDGFEENYRVLSKNELLKGFILFKIKQYNYAVELNLKLLSTNQNEFDKVTEIFVKDLFGERDNSNYDFSTQFTYNISRKTQQLFYDEIERIFE
jgi:hypothetical protein